MKTTSSKTIVLSGFSGLLLLLIFLSVTLQKNESEHRDRLKQIGDARQKSSLVFLMRDAVHQRAIALYRMISIEDPFERDDEYMRFIEVASQFIDARETFLSMPINRSESETWNKIRPTIVKASRYQGQVVNLIQDQQYSKANKILLNNVIPTQTRVIDELTHMHDIQQQQIQSLLAQARKDSDSIILQIAILTGTIILLGVIITTFVVKRTTKTEAELLLERKRAQSASNHKSTFIANMSHEIRTPLTTIIGFSENLLMEKQTPVQRLSSSKTILRNARHLLQVLTDILDLSKIESNKMEIEPSKIPIIPFIADIESLIGGMARDRGLDFSVHYQYPIPEHFFCDPVRLKQVLLNLLSNSIKFTKSGLINIAVSYQKSDQTITFRISDTGIGMSENQMKSLFVPFVQGDATSSREYGGTGLGLSICKHLLLLMKGSIEVKSNPGLGTQTKIVLPIAGKVARMILSESDLLQRQPHTELVNTKIQTHGKVLLVEDNPETQNLISSYIKNTGASVSVADNGQTALDLVSNNQFDLIFLDIQLPVMDGIETLQTLRRNRCKTPIVILTANAMKDSKKKYLELGADDFVAKPIDRSEFNTVLARYLEKAKASKIDHNGKDLEDMTHRSASKLDFIQKLPNELGKLKDSAKKRSWMEACKAATKLKGLSGKFGDTEITRLIQQIETSAKDHRFEKTVESIETLEDYFNEHEMSSIH